MSDHRYQSPSYRRSRWAYTIECAFEYFVSLLVTDAFLATLLIEMGLSDAVIGMISSLISLAFLFQLFSVFVVQHIRSIKLVAIPIHTISQMFFILLYLLPFFSIPAPFRTAIIVGCILIGYLGNYLITAVIFNWGNTYVDPATRANFAATKEVISLLSGTFISLVLGWLVDQFMASGNIAGSFILIAVMMAIFSASDFICLMLMKNPPPTQAAADKPEPFWQIVRKLLENRSFICTVIVNILWNTSVYMSLGFMGTYKTRDLFLSMGTIQMINLAARLLRALFSKPIAAYTDQTSYARGIKLGMVIAAVGYFINIFTTPRLWWLIILYTILYQIACAGTEQNLINMTYSYVDQQYFVQASAIRASVGGLCGFIASIVGSKILNGIQNAGNTVFGITIYGQQILSAISLVISLLGILFVRFVLQKQRIIAK